MIKHTKKRPQLPCVKDTAAQCDVVPSVHHAFISVCSTLVNVVVRQADKQAGRKSGYGQTKSPTDPQVKISKERKAVLPRKATYKI